ncbi:MULTISPECIES: antibiotic biosynthesis monooxygenase family protein [Xenorhabdus]|uniref:antibiotic biosynthesis monooxygenase family protein n=1 Tax=Xenorhabdus TaxID=626 RepID=UPI000AB64A6A|nr:MULTISPECIES: antibiotic biosynthesis monooxygenase [Xenorhabdus]MBC8945339.1 antibiotic biosynthesis monooxygenase [Xenorhabdus indica]
MLAVIFEVEIAENQSERYFDAAATLRPLLNTIPGFISVERFQSLNNKKRPNGFQAASRRQGNESLEA